MKEEKGRRNLKKIKVLPARFERTTYRLGGSRSIQLSYESVYQFRILDCGLPIVKFYDSYLTKERTS